MYIAPWIFTTYRCNLNCSYCYVRQTPHDMTERVYEMINTRIEELLKETISNVVYRIAGGEPMLVFNTWKKPISKMVHKYPDQVTCGLISNLTILTKEQKSFFEDHKFGFGISLDSLSFSKPFKSGLTSSNIVMRNIDILNQHERTDISTVISIDSIDDIDKLAEWIAERNLNWGIYLDHYYNKDLDLVYVVEKITDAVDVLVESGYDVIKKFKFNNIKIGVPYDGCTAGENLIAIDVKGNVHDCQTAIYGTPTCHISKFVPITSPKHLLPSECEGCPLEQECGGGCKLNNNFGETCDITKLVFSYILMRGNNNAEL